MCQGQVEPVFKRRREGTGGAAGSPRDENDLPVIKGEKRRTRRKGSFAKAAKDGQLRQRGYADFKWYVLTSPGGADAGEKREKKKSGITLKRSIAHG